MIVFNFPKFTSIVLLPMLCMTVVALVGCATAKPPPQSGFLESYAELKQDPNDKSLLWWEVSEFNWTDYNAVLIDPVTIYLHPDSEGVRIHPDELVKLANEFKSAVVEELGQNISVVSEAGPGVLQIQTAITDIKPANVSLNVVTTLVAMVPWDMGGASIEVRFIDSATGKRMAAGMDQKLGIPLQVRKGFTDLGHANQAFKDWANELKIALETNPGTASN